MRFCFDLFEVSFLIRLLSQSSKISGKMELFSCFQSSLKLFLGDVLEKIYFLGDFLLFQILCSIFYIKLSIITSINSATNGSGSTPEKVFHQLVLILFNQQFLLQGQICLVANKSILFTIYINMQRKLDNLFDFYLLKKSKIRPVESPMKNYETMKSYLTMSQLF